jgi:antitoxin component YwqK of YwqJK toxin-antitoxin module
MFSFFNNKKRTFDKNLAKAAEAAHVLASNPFLTSLNKQEIARNQRMEIREWWVSNVDNYKNEASISENDFELMRICLELPDTAKYKNINGKKKTYYPNGQIETEWNFVNGAKHGIQRGWYENGKLAFEHNYISDYCDGISRVWYDNGNLQSEHNYKFTEENINRLSDKIGWQKEYYGNGVIKEEWFYNENTYEYEKLIRYYENGSIEEIREFKNDEIYCREYNKEGGIIKEWRM